MLLEWTVSLALSGRIALCRYRLESTMTGDCPWLRYYQPTAIPIPAGLESWTIDRIHFQIQLKPQDRTGPTPTSRAEEEPRSTPVWVPASVPVCQDANFC